MSASTGADEGGFALVEVMVASVILLIVAISLTTVLVSSLGASGLARQQEAAASIASDTIENAKAIGLLALSASLPSGRSCPVSLPASVAPSATVPVLAAAPLQQPHWIALDHTAFCVGTSVDPSTTVAVVTVEVSWASGHFTSVGAVGT